MNGGARGETTGGETNKTKTKTCWVGARGQSAQHGRRGSFPVGRWHHDPGAGCSAVAVQSTCPTDALRMWCTSAWRLQLGPVAAACGCRHGMDTRGDRNARLVGAALQNSLPTAWAPPPRLPPQSPSSPCPARSLPPLPNTTGSGDPNTPPLARGPRAHVAVAAPKSQPGVRGANFECGVGRGGGGSRTELRYKAPPQGARQRSAAGKARSKRGAAARASTPAPSSRSHRRRVSAVPHRDGRIPVAARTATGCICFSGIRHAAEHCGGGQGGM